MEHFASPPPETPSSSGRAARGEAFTHSHGLPLPSTHKALRPGNARMGDSGPLSGTAYRPVPWDLGGRFTAPLLFPLPPQHLPKKSTHCFSSPLPRYLKIKLGRREGRSKDARCATPARHWLRSPSFTIRFA